MKGLMQDWPLLTTQVLKHAARWHGEREVVSRDHVGGFVRESYVMLEARARRVAAVLSQKLGVRQGEFIGTIAATNIPHLEAWYGIMGMGAVVHTINPRLHDDQLAYTINHAEDTWLFVDPLYLAIIERLQHRLSTVKGYIILCDRARMPATTLRSLYCYEELLAAAGDDYVWPVFDENTACGLCYTSGTTGNPKGVLYSHRSQMLHALIASNGDASPRSSQDRVMPLSPLYHVSSWGIPLMAPMCGADLVLPGSKFDGASIFEMLDQERVTEVVSVPTIWGALQAHLEAHPELHLKHLKKIVIGGSALPPSQHTYFSQIHGVPIRQGYGMTEMSPLGTLGNPKGKKTEVVSAAVELTQGRPIFGFDMEIVDDFGAVLPHDGKHSGHMRAKGPAVARSYFKGESPASFDADGWFTTGDIGTIDEEGYLRLTDRSKDVIKSGGEWISSIDLENVAMGCEGVAMAAAIAIAHPKWDERPLLAVVRRSGSDISAADVLKHLEGKIAKWWTPDAVVFVDSLPLTGTGKVSKLVLREQFKDHAFQ